MQYESRSLSFAESNAESKELFGQDNIPPSKRRQHLPEKGYVQFDGRIIELVRQKVIGPHAYLVYVTLCAHADTRGQCHPSRPTIAQETGLSGRSVLRAVERLTAAGVLVVVKRRQTGPGTKGNLSNFYTLNPVPVLGATEALPLVTPAPPPSDSQAPPLVTQRHPNQTHVQPDSFTPVPPPSPPFHGGNPAVASLGAGARPGSPGDFPESEGQEQAVPYVQQALPIGFLVVEGGPTQAPDPMNPASRAMDGAEKDAKPMPGLFPDMPSFAQGSPESGANGQLRPSTRTNGLEPYSGAFEDRFWALWPNHPRKNDKRAAFKAYQRATRNSRDQDAIERIERMVGVFTTSVAWNEEHRRYLPMPSSWLNKGSYDVDPEDVPQWTEADAHYSSRVGKHNLAVHRELMEKKARTGRMYEPY